MKASTISVYFKSMTVMILCFSADYLSNTMSDITIHSLLRSPFFEQLVLDVRPMRSLTDLDHAIVTTSTLPFNFSPLLWLWPCRPGCQVLTLVIVVVVFIAQWVCDVHQVSPFSTQQFASGNIRKGSSSSNAASCELLLVCTRREETTPYQGGDHYYCPHSMVTMYCSPKQRSKNLLLSGVLPRLLFYHKA